MRNRFSVISFVRNQERAPLTLGLFCISFLALIGLRLTIELGLSGFKPEALTELFFTFAHTFLFFLLSFLLFLPVLTRGAELPFKQAANALLFGFLVIILPPIIDKLIFGSGLYWSFYTFDSLHGLWLRYFTFFGDSPRIGITYGVRVEVALVVIGLIGYVQSRLHSWKHSLSIGLFSYTLLFFLGTLPSWLTFLLLAPHGAIMQIQGVHIAQYFLSPEQILGRDFAPLRAALSQKMSLVYALAVSFAVVITFWRTAPRFFHSLFANVRFPQILYHGGLLLLGMMLAFIFQRPVLGFSFFDGLALCVLLVAIGLAWIAAVIFNDIIDINIDRITNPKRPLPTKTIPARLYATFGFIALGFSIFFACLVQFQAGLLLIGYQAISLLYSLPPFRLKQFPLVATGTAALAGMLIFCIGYLSLTPAHSLAGLPLSLFFFMFLAYTVSLPLKDFKDIEGDAADGVLTIPVLLGQERARHVMSTAIFAIFIASVFFLHAPGIFPWTLIWSTAAFWLIEKAERSRLKALSFRYLPGWVLFCVFCYGAGLLLFLS